jgi:2,4-dienoyl-CoA reductase (NADPH2)
VQKTNLRTDRWGGPWENRMRFAVEVVRRVRAAVGPNFIVVFRISAMDMLEGGLAWDEIVSLGQGRRGRRRQHHQHPFLLARGAGAHHRHDGAARGLCQRHRPAAQGTLRVPMITSNRINMPQVAEDVLARGDADLVSMARPMLADPDLVNKAA